MRFNVLFAALVVALSFCFAAEFSVTPYLYATEKTATVDFATFSINNSSTAKLVSVNGDSVMLVIDGKLVTDKNTITSAITEYYTKNFYPSNAELTELQGYADSFNKSRNAQTRYGPAEKTCYEGGTFLSYHPCHDMTSCMATASLVCTISGAEGCTADFLATHILSYSLGVDKLNNAYAKFQTGFSGFGPTTVSVSLDQMNSAFDEMKSAADELSKSKLIAPETYYCGDCMGRCPEPRYDYSSLAAGKAKITALRAKAAPFANLNEVVEEVALSTVDRIAFKEGEEKATVFVPRFDSARAKFGGLKAQAVLAKALVSDSNFVSVADDFISREDKLEQNVDKRKFDGFDALLMGYESAGNSLAAMINNSTRAYYLTVDAQDHAGDLLLQAMWKAEGKDQKLLNGYNSLAGRKIALDGKFVPPMTNSEYAALAKNYSTLSFDSQQFIHSSGAPTDSIFVASNNIERTSVDGAMTLAANFVPISFSTRQSMARYIPPVVLGVIDLSLLALVLTAFIAVFYRFQGAFKSKLAISGWALTAVAFVMVLVIGSVGFYGIVLSSEQFTSFTEFFSSVRSADKVAVVVRETGASNDAINNMRACADQIQSQVSLLGKSTNKYYISGTSCRQFISKPANNSAGFYYEETAGLSSDKCLNGMPDVPVFDLRYALENKPPAFTTVVVKQAIFTGNEAYYAKKPMCDAANVLG